MASEFLFIVKTDPQDTIVAQEVLSEILTFAAFDVPLKVLFMDQGVRFLLNPLDDSLAGMIRSFSLYGINALYVEWESLTDRCLSHMACDPEVQILHRASLSGFIEGHEHVIDS